MANLQHECIIVYIPQTRCQKIPPEKEKKNLFLHVGGFSAIVSSLIILDQLANQLQPIVQSIPTSIFCFLILRFIIAWKAGDVEL